MPTALPTAPPLGMEKGREVWGGGRAHRGAVTWHPGVWCLTEPHVSEAI